MTTYGPFPRGADGKIILGPLIDDSALRDEPPPAPPAPAPAAAGSPAAPPRRPGDAPTPFGQLRPGPVGGAPAPAADSWRLWLAAGVVLAVLAAAIYALLPRAVVPAALTASAAATAAPAPAATPTATPPAELARAIVVFDAPGGAPIGALEPGRRYVLLDEAGGWRQLDVPGSGEVWARAWEMDGAAPPTATPQPTPAPAPPPVVRPAPAQVVQPPPVPQRICREVLDADNGNRSLGQACGLTLDEVHAEALRMLAAAPPPTLDLP